MTITCLLEFSRQVNRAYDAQCEPLCRKFELSRTSLDILLFLANNPRFYTAKDISLCRSIKPNVVSLHVEQLVQDGYLTRTAVPEDRRKIRLRCTDRAAPVIREGIQMQKHFHRQLTAGLSPEELDGFRHCFQVITRNASLTADTQ